MERIAQSCQSYAQRCASDGHWGSYVPPVAFVSVNRVYRVTVQIVTGLSDAQVLGAAFIREHKSIIISSDIIDKWKHYQFNQS